MGGWSGVELTGGGIRQGLSLQRRKERSQIIGLPTVLTYLALNPFGSALFQLSDHYQCDVLLLLLSFFHLHSPQFIYTITAHYNI